MLDGYFLLKNRAKLKKPFFFGWICFKIYHVVMSALLIGRFNPTNTVVHTKENSQFEKKEEMADELFTFMSEKAALVFVGGFEIAIGFMFVLGVVLAYITQR